MKIKIVEHETICKQIFKCSLKRAFFVEPACDECDILVNESCNYKQSLMDHSFPLLRIITDTFQ